MNINNGSFRPKCHLKSKLSKRISVDNIIHGVSIIDHGISTDNNPNLVDEVQNYFKGISQLSSRYIASGTEFQIKVWEKIAEIPYGQTRTYSEIAAAIGIPNSYRAVANACGANNVLLFIPCHRVVGKNNRGGFKYGLDKKIRLLELESKSSLSL